jgi:integrase
VASLIRNEQRGTWAVQWHDGRRRRRTTVVPKRNGWKPGDGMPKKAPVRATEALAEYQRREDDARRNRAGDRDVTVAGFLGEYLAGYAAGARPSSVEQLGRSAKVFLAYCADRKVELVSAVTPAVVDGFLTWRTGHAAHNTAKKDAALVAGAWSKAVRLRALPDNPWKGVPVPGKPPGPRKSSWSPAEYRTLQEKCRPWLRAVLTLGCNTGLRVFALTRLEWRDLKFSQAGEAGFGVVTVRKELDKARKGYTLPMSKDCHDLLFRVRATGKGGNACVLSGQGGRPIGCTRSVATAIHRAARRAGLPRPDAPNHAMRRTFGRWAVLGHLTGRPVPLYVVSRWLGHHSTRQTEEYLDLREHESQDWMAPA